MAKVNSARKSDSWRPGMVANGSGMISKNQKRKEKRYSHNLSSLKSQDTPTKKSLLGPLTKFKENLNQSLNLPSLGKKENKLLSTSLPIKADKKLTPSLKKIAKPTGILSNSNTPKAKGNKVTFNMDKNVDKFIDSEAEEGEEPVTDKVVKPYEKGNQKKQMLKRRMSMDVEESDEDSDSDDESFNSASEFVDVEASEGEETDSADEESYDENSDDDFLNDDSDEGSDEEVDDEAGSAEEMDSDENSVDSEDESDEDSDEEMPVVNSSKVATPNRRESMAAVALKKGIAESTPQSKKVKPEPATPQPKKVDFKTESTPLSKKANAKFESEQKKVPEPKKEKVAETPVKGKTQQATVEKTQSQETVQKAATVVKEEKVKKEGKKEEEAVVGETSPYVGFIRRIFKKISIEDVKSALSKRIDTEKIVGLRLTRDRNVFVYLTNEETLNLLLNYSFAVNENFKFVVYKARDSASEKKPKFAAFLPKVPLTISTEQLKEAIVNFVGTDCVEAIKFRKVNRRSQTRIVLVHFEDVESLQKLVEKGELQVGSVPVVFRAAFETTVDVPSYKVLVTSIPAKTTEAMLKKAIESQVGKDTVQNVQFSQKKSSFAFVTMKSEEARMKTLEIGDKISVNGKKVEVVEFKPHKPFKKRAAPSEQAKEKKKNKAKKRKLADGSASNAPNPGKKNKAAAQQKDASPKVNAPKPPQTQSKGAATQPDAQKEAPISNEPKVAAKFKKNKKFPKPGKGAKANQEAQSPGKGPAPGKGAKPEPQSPNKGPFPGKGANLKQGANQNQEARSPASGPAAGKGANQKQRQKNSKKGATNPQSQSPVSMSVNGTSPSSPKKKKNKNKQQQQQSPKPVDAKKQALVEKIASKKQKKKNSMRRDSS